MSSTVESFEPSTSESTRLNPRLVFGSHGDVSMPIFPANSVARSTPTRGSLMTLAKHVLDENAMQSVRLAVGPSAWPVTDHGGWPAALMTSDGGAEKVVVGLTPLASAAASTIGLKVDPA